MRLNVAVQRSITFIGCTVQLSDGVWQSEPRCSAPPSAKLPRSLSLPRNFKHSLAAKHGARVRFVVLLRSVDAQQVCNFSCVVIGHAQTRPIAACLPSCLLVGFAGDLLCSSRNMSGDRRFILWLMGPDSNLGVHQGFYTGVSVF